MIVNRSLSAALTRGVFALLALLPLAGLAQVQEPIDAPTWPAGSPPEGWRPGPFVSSSWFDVARDGSGWALSRLPNLPGSTLPFYSGTVYTYDDAGNPYWLLMTGEWQQTTWQQFFLTGEIGRISGGLVDGRQGACPVCPYVRPVVEPSPYGTAEIRFIGGDGRAEVRMDGVLTETIRPSELNLWTPVEELLVGFWNENHYDGIAGKIYGFSGIDDTIVRMAGPPTWFNNLQTLNGDVLRVPSLQNSVFYRFDGIPTDEEVLVYDKSDGTIIAYRFTQGQPIIETNRRVGYRMSENDGITRYVLINDHTMVRVHHRNSRDPQAAPGNPHLAYRMVKEG